MVQTVSLRPWMVRSKSASASFPLQPVWLVIQETSYLDISGYWYGFPQNKYLVNLYKKVHVINYNNF